MKTERPKTFRPKQLSVMFFVCGLIILPTVPLCAQSAPHIINPSFERDEFTLLNGRESIGGHNPGGITGWLHSNPTTGVSSAPPNWFEPTLADNGIIPDGEHVAFIQGNGTLSQIIGGLTPRSKYQVSFYENANQYNFTNLQGVAVDPVSLSVLIDDEVICDPHVVKPAGETNSYRKVVTRVFTVPGNLDFMKLTFQVTGSRLGKGAVLLDNVRIDPVGMVGGDRPRQKHLKHFGQINTDTQYFGSQGSKGDINKYSSVAWIENYGPDFNLGKLSVAGLEGDVDPSQAVDLIKGAAAKGLTAHVVLHYIFFDADYKLRLDWQTRWTTFANGLKGVAGNITSFSVIDEPFLATKGKKALELCANIETVNKAIKATFPEIPIAVIYAFRTLADVNNLIFPDGFDWVGFDAYPLPHGKTFDNMEGYSLPWFYNLIRDHLKPGQRTFLVPEMHQMGWVNNPMDFNPKLVNNYNRLLQLGMEDPLCVAVFNYTYPTYRDAKNPNSSEIGMDTTPFLRAEATMYLNHIFTDKELVLTPFTFTTSNPKAFGETGFKNAFDHNPETVWKAAAEVQSGDWIQADYQQPWSVSKVRFSACLTAVDPKAAPGSATLTLYGGASLKSMHQLQTVSIKSNAPTAEILVPASVGNVRFLKIVFDKIPTGMSIGLREIGLVSK